MPRKKYLGALSSLLVFWPVIVGCLATSALSNWAGLTLVSVLFLLLGLLGLLSRLWGMTALRQASAGLECTQCALFSGESVTITYTVENKGLLPMMWLEVCQNAPLNRCLVPDHTFSLYELDEPEARVEGVGALYRRRLLFLLGWRALSWETVWTAQRRGVYPVTHLILRSGDGFGLTQSAKRISLPAPPTLVVYPKLVAVNPGPFLRNVWQGRTGRRGYMEDPTVLRTLRDYQPTDSWKRIDWRMAARQEELQVKQFETVLPATIHFIVDGASFVGLSDENDELEEALSILGSLLLELDRAGITCGLSLPATAGSPPATRPPTDPSLTVQDLLIQLSAFDGDTATGDFDHGQLASLAQSVGQLWLINYSKQRLTCRPLLDLLEGRGLGVISWDGAPSERYQVLALSSLKKGGGRP